MTNILLLSSVSGISSLNWITVWLMIEVNTLAMCFIITNDSNNENTNNINTISYFLVQIISSSLIIILVTSQSNLPTIEILLVLCLIINIGVWPFHLWYISILSYTPLNNTSTLLLITWQNLIPAVIMSILEISVNIKLILISICLISLIIPIVKINTIQSNMVIALSSLNNNSWIILSSLSSLNTLLIIISFYSFTLAITLNKVNNISNIFNKTPYTLINYLALFANLSGMPPFTLFWINVIIVQDILINSININSIVVIVIISCIIVSLYLIITIPLFINTINNSQNTIINTNSDTSNIKNILVSSSLASITIAN